jgi:hypothetical protein
MLGHGKRHRGLQSRPLRSGVTLPAVGRTSWLVARVDPPSQKKHRRGPKAQERPSQRGSILSRFPDNPDRDRLSEGCEVGEHDD